MTQGMNRLDLVQSAQVLDYISKNYTASKMTDVKFAEKATKDLGFTVHKSHIEKRRHALKIEPAISRNGPRNTAALFELVAELEKRIVALEKGIRV